MTPTNIRAVRPIAMTAEPMSHKIASALGSTAAQIEWAISAIEAGDSDRALQYLAKAQIALKPVVPGLTMGGTEFYIPSPPVRSVA